MARNREGKETASRSTQLLCHPVSFDTRLSPHHPRRLAASLPPGSRTAMRMAGTRAERTIASFLMPTLVQPGRATVPRKSWGWGQSVESPRTFSSCRRKEATAVSRLGGDTS